MTGNAIAHVGTSLAQQERELRYYQGQAEIFCRTGLVQPALKGKADDTLLVMVTALRLQSDPVAAIQGTINVIGGRASLSSQLRLGLARTARHEIWLVESTDKQATYSGQRRGSKHVQTITWTIEQAKRAGLLEGKNWKHYPEAMLRARAASNLVTVLCPEVAMGLPETPMEYEAEFGVIDEDVVENDKQLVAGPEVASPAREVGSESATEEAVPTGGDEVPSVASDTPKPGAADGTFTAEDEKFAGAEFGKRYTQAARTAGLNEPEIEALVSHATGGRTTNPANVYAGREAKLLGQWFVAVRDDEYGFITGNDGSVRVVKVVSHAGENVGQPGEDDDA